jgi:hypothetical protein
MKSANQTGSRLRPGPEQGEQTKKSRRPLSGDCLRCFGGRNPLGLSDLARLPGHAFLGNW